jgi:hypothetical protein
MNIKKNVGGADRVIRIIVGLSAVGAGIYYENWWGLLGIALILTGVFSFCGLYTILGISTCPVKGPSVPNEAQKP